jgi:hypothetical protein
VFGFLATGHLSQELVSKSVLYILHSPNMSKCSIVVLLFTALWLCINAQNDPEKEKPVVTLQKWQYCAGCKATVEIFANLATKEIMKMQESGIPVGEDLNISPMMSEVCGHQFMEAYQPFVGHACGKLMNDHKQDFMDVFEGTDASSAFSTVKGNIYAKTKQVCMCL